MSRYDKIIVEINKRLEIVIHQIHLAYCCY